MPVWLYRREFVKSSLRVSEALTCTLCYRTITSCTIDRTRCNCSVSRRLLTANRVGVFSTTRDVHCWVCLLHNKERRHVTYNLLGSACHLLGRSRPVLGWRVDL